MSLSFVRISSSLSEEVAERGDDGADGVCCSIIRIAESSRARNVERIVGSVK